LLAVAEIESTSWKNYIDGECFDEQYIDDTSCQSSFTGHLVAFTENIGPTVEVEEKRIIDETSISSNSVGKVGKEEYFQDSDSYINIQSKLVDLLEQEVEESKSTLREAEELLKMSSSVFNTT